jgi:hypothetical protein
MIRTLVTVAVLCLLGTSANAALSMEECEAKYKAAQAATKRYVAWTAFQERQCGIKPKAAAPKPAPAAPVRH